MKKFLSYLWGNAGWGFAIFITVFFGIGIANVIIGEDITGKVMISTSLIILAIFILGTFFSFKKLKDQDDL